MKVFKSDLPANNDNVLCSSCCYWVALDVRLATPSFDVGFGAGDVDRAILDRNGECSEVI